MSQLGWKTGAKYLVVAQGDDYGRVVEASRYDVENFSSNYIIILDDYIREEDTGKETTHDTGYLVVQTDEGRYALNGFVGKPTVPASIDAVQPEEAPEEGEEEGTPADAGDFEVAAEADTQLDGQAGAGDTSEQRFVELD